MGISDGYQGLNRVLDEQKGRFVFNFFEHLVVYSSRAEEHEVHVLKVCAKIKGLISLSTPTN